jgi:hypothetical protein
MYPRYQHSSEIGSSMKPKQGSFVDLDSGHAEGRLDYQLAELIEYVWACEAAAAKADRIEASLRWVDRESLKTKGEEN